jgi:hypothetical protein
MRVSGSQTLMIGASPAACRAALLDLGRYPEWYPGVREAEVLEAGPGAASARLRFSTGLPVLASVDCTLRLEPRGADGLRPLALEGDLEIDGSGWTLAAEPDGATLATYDIGVEMSVPGGFVTERLVKSRARHFLIEEPVAALKRLVESAA